MTQTVTRKTARRGDTVTVTERNGTAWNGTLTGFGAQVVAVRLDEETQERTGCTWKVRSFAACLVTVTR